MTKKGDHIEADILARGLKLRKFTGYHWRIGGLVDLWPTTERWGHVTGGRTRIGLKALYEVLDLMQPFSTMSYIKACAVIGHDPFKKKRPKKQWKKKWRRPVQLELWHKEPPPPAVHSDAGPEVDSSRTDVPW